MGRLFLATETAMPTIQWAPFFAFMISTTLSPGPNNMASAANGLQYGFKKTMPFILGIICGFFIDMLAIAFISSAVLRVIPQFQIYIKFIGGAYILWLAYRALSVSFQVGGQDQPPLTFANGFTLQFVNPKVIFFGLAAFTGFLNPLTDDAFYLLIAAAGLSFWVFLMNAFWAGAGSVIFNYFDRPAVKRAFSLAVAAMLVYAALNIMGVFEYLESLGWL